MKIVQVISHYVPATRFGGPQHVAHGLGRALTRLGHDVTVCTTNLADERRDLDVPSGVERMVDGVRVFYDATGWSRYWGYAPEMRSRLYRELADTDLVLVHFHFQYANFVGARVARQLGRRYFLFPHGSLRRDALRRKGRLRKSWYLRWFEHANLTQAERVLFNADEELRSSLPLANAGVLPNGLEPGDYEPLPPPGEFRARHSQVGHNVLAVFLGRLDYLGKGLDLLLPALWHSRQQGRPVHLVLAGPDERGGEAATRRQVAQLGLSRDVTFLGLVTGREKLALLRDADFLVLPSRSEGLSITVLEALYLGIPLLVTNQVGLHETIVKRNAGLAVEPTAPGVREGFLRLLDEPVREGMRAAGTAWVVQHHTWTAIAQQLLEMTHRP
ncbi:MAG TPA: glycosyltransferase [Pirellulaceae bacterium]